MIKGVNRQVVEVAETGCDYFERALFFVNPKYYGISDGKLREKANSVVSAAGSPPKSRQSQKNSKIKNILLLALSAFAGSAATLIANTLIF